MMILVKKVYVWEWEIIGYMVNNSGSMTLIWVSVFFRGFQAYRPVHLNAYLPDLYLFESLISGMRAHGLLGLQ